MIDLDVSKIKNTTHLVVVVEDVTSFNRHQYQYAVKRECNNLLPIELVESDLMSQGIKLRYNTGQCLKLSEYLQLNGLLPVEDFSSVVLQIIDFAQNKRGPLMLDYLFLQYDSAYIKGDGFLIQFPFVPVRSSKVNFDNAFKTFIHLLVREGCNYKRDSAFYDEVFEKLEIMNFHVSDLAELLQRGPQKKGDKSSIPPNVTSTKVLPEIRSHNPPIPTPVSSTGSSCEEISSEGSQSTKVHFSSPTQIGSNIKTESVIQNTDSSRTYVVPQLNSPIKENDSNKPDANIPFELYMIHNAFILLAVFSTLNISSVLTRIIVIIIIIFLNTMFVKISRSIYK